MPEKQKKELEEKKIVLREIDDLSEIVEDVEEEQDLQEFTEFVQPTALNVQGSQVLESGEVQDIEPIENLEQGVGSMRTDSENKEEVIDYEQHSLEQAYKEPETQQTGFLEPAESMRISRRRFVTERDISNLPAQRDFRQEIRAPADIGLARVRAPNEEARIRGREAEYKTGFDIEGEKVSDVEKRKYKLH